MSEYIAQDRPLRVRARNRGQRPSAIHASAEAAEWSAALASTAYDKGYEQAQKDIKRALGL